MPDARREIHYDEQDLERLCNLEMEGPHGNTKSRTLDCLTPCDWASKQCFGSIKFACAVHLRTVYLVTNLNVGGGGVIRCRTDHM